MKNQNPYYVGIEIAKPHQYVAFKPLLAPVEENYKKQFLALIGPFKTKRGAEFMAKYGKGNPHCQHVSDAELLAKHADFLKQSAPIAFSKI